MSILISKSPDLIVAALNPVGFEIAVDPNWDTFDDYYVLVRVEYEPDYRSGTFEPLITFRTTPDENEKIEFDIQSRLEQIVEADPPNPAISGGARCEKMVKRWTIHFEEFINGSGQGESSQYTRYAVKAGFAFRSSNRLWTWASANEKALTHANRSREITINFPAWMYFYVNAPASSLNLKAEITYSDGTDETVTLFSLSGITQSDFVYFPVGYQQTGMHTRSKQVSYYEFWVETSVGTVISDKHIYSLRRKCTSLDRYYVFENSLGGFDTVHTRGKAKTSNNTQSQQATRYVGPFYTLLQRPNVIYKTESNHEVEQHVGFSRLDDQLWLRDLLRTETAFRIGGLSPTLSHSTELTPIEIDRGKTPILEDNVFLSELKFTYTDELSRGL